jgi:hypothetical protein
MPCGQTHWYDELHVCPAAHEGHGSVLPHPSGGDPHWAPAAAHDATGVQTHVLPGHVSGELQRPPAQHCCPVSPQATQPPPLHTWFVAHVPHETPQPSSPHVLPVQLPMQLQSPFGLHV